MLTQLLTCDLLKCHIYEKGFWIKYKLMSGQDKYNIRIISTQSAKVRSTPVMVVLELLNKMRENKVIHSAMLSENASASFVIHFKALLDCRDMLLESLNENSTNVVALCGYIDYVFIPT